MGGEAKGKLFEISLWKQLKSNYSLMPIAFIGVFGISLSAFAILRTLTKSPDVQLNRRGNPKPYEKLVTPEGAPVQYKYYTTIDYNKLPSTERPKLD